MGKKLIRKNSLILVVSAILLSMVTACDAKPSDVPVSSININTVSTSETSDPSVSVPDKVITTGIDVIDMEDNTKQIKVYVDERRSTVCSICLKEPDLFLSVTLLRG